MVKVEHQVSPHLVRQKGHGQSVTPSLTPSGETERSWSKCDSSDGTERSWSHSPTCGQNRKEKASTSRAAAGLQEARKRS